MGSNPPILDYCFLSCNNNNNNNNNNKSINNFSKYHTHTHTGDRIAIISKGSLLCCGSFDYLKHHFGRGHRLTLVTKVQSDRRASVSSRTFTVTADVEDTDMSAHADATDAPREPIFEECAEAELTTLIQQVITGATLIERRGREVHYRLPLLHARPRILAKLFTQLEEEKGRLGIMSCRQDEANRGE